MKVCKGYITRSTSSQIGSELRNQVEPVRLLVMSTVIASPARTGDISDYFSLTGSISRTPAKPLSALSQSSQPARQSAPADRGILRARHHPPFRNARRGFDQPFPAGETTRMIWPKR